MSHLKFYERNPIDQFYYHTESIYIRERERKNAVVCLAKMAKFTTRPDMEVRYMI